MPADGTKAAHLANGNLGTSRLEQLLKTIQHVLVCKEGDSSSHFRKWHEADIQVGAPHVRYQGRPEATRTCLDGRV